MKKEKKTQTFEISDRKGRFISSLNSENTSNLLSGLEIYISKYTAYYLT